MIIHEPCFSLCAALAQTAAPVSVGVPLSPDAQEAVKNGMLAAKEQNFQLAARYFQAARKTAPDAPEIYYDLGVAESKIPGREMRAIAWFSAYLAADPNAPNATAVNDQIDLLDVKSQSDVSRVIKSVQDQAGQRDDNLDSVARLWAMTGDMNAALSIANQIKSSGWRTDALKTIGYAQLLLDDFIGAQRTAGQIQHPNWKGILLASIATSQAMQGDIGSAKNNVMAALENVNQVQTASWKIIILREVADAQLAMGDITVAQSTLATALKVTNQIPDEKEKKSYRQRSRLLKRICQPKYGHRE